MREESPLQAGPGPEFSGVLDAVQCPPACTIKGCRRPATSPLLTEDGTDAQPHLTQLSAWAVRDTG